MDYVGLGLHWNDLTVGQKFRTINRTITEADLVNFINATGMVEMIFTDATYAGQGAIQGSRPVPGALAYCFSEGLLVQSTMQHTGLAMLETTLKILGPTNVNDTIHVEVEVADFVNYLNWISVLFQSDGFCTSGFGDKPCASQEKQEK